MRLDLVDVFGARPLAGNPLGVVHGAEALDGEAMLRLTQWLGFSETTSLLQPEDPKADYRVRIFCPARELPFAGHPTLGTCHAWLAAGGKPKRDGVVVQECGVGLVEIRRQDDLLAFKAPPLFRTGPLSETERAEAVRLAGVRNEWIAEGVHAALGADWQLLRLHSAEQVLAADPVMLADGATYIGLVGPHDPGSGVDWEVRGFFPKHENARAEDPVTGSLNASVAVHLFTSNFVSGSYVAGQGQKVGADGRIYCSVDEEGAIWIGGKVATIAAGAELPAFA